MAFSFNGNTPKAITFNNQNVKKLIYNNTIVWEMQSGLPSEYRQLTYIESSGTQYLETGIKINTQYKYVTKFKSTPQSSARYIFMNNSSPFLGLTNPARTAQNSIYYNTSSNVSLGVNLNDIEIELSRTLKRTDTGEILYTGASDFTSNQTMKLFGTSADNRRSVSRIYYFKVYDNNNNLICDLVPCYRKSDGEIGMYDIVNNVFRTNIGTGTFIAGEKTMPEEYQKLGYIESTGTQYINTGVIANESTEFDIKFYSNNNFTTSGYGTMFGTRQASNSNQFYLTSYGTSTGGGQFRWASSTTNNINMAKQEIMNISLHDRVLTKNDGTTINIGSASASFTTPSSISIFALNENGSIVQYGKLCLYSFKLYNGNTIVRNYIPCYRKSDGEIGLYDLTNDVFYINQGTGIFIKGPEPIELPSEYQQVEYIEGTGTQYIDTEFKPNQNTRLFAKIYIGTINGDAIKAIFGTRKSDYSDSFSCFYVGGQKVETGRMRLDYGDITDNNNIHYYPGTQAENLYKIDYNKNVGTLNGDTYTFNLQTYASVYNLLLLTCNTGGTVDNRMVSGKIYYCKIYDNDVLVRDFIPCYRKSDNVIGLYDKVNNVFYTNSGTGIFTKGLDVN